MAIAMRQGVQVTAANLGRECADRCGHLELDGVGGAVGHAKLAQAEGGRQIGSEQARAQHHRLVSIQVPAKQQAILSAQS